MLRQMNIVHISDIHYRRTYEAYDEGYKGMLANMQDPLLPLEKCLTKINSQLPIDLLIISGDLTDGGDTEDYRIVKETVESVVGNVPTVVTLGNHDRKSDFRKGWLKESGHSAEPYNSIDLFEDLCVISFDNSVFGQTDGYISERQFEWLDSAFTESKGKPILFVTHHHLLEGQSSVSCLPEAEKLLNMLNEQNVMCILTGHTHQPYTDKVKGMVYITVAGMSFVGEDKGDGMVRFEEQYGYNIYQIVNGEIREKNSEVFSTGKLLKLVNMANVNPGE